MKGALRKTAAEARRKNGSSMPYCCQLGIGGVLTTLALANSCHCVKYQTPICARGSHGRPGHASNGAASNGAASNGAPPHQHGHLNGAQRSQQLLEVRVCVVCWISPCTDAQCRLTREQRTNKW